MDKSPAATIDAANSALIAGGRLEVIAEFFAPDYVAHLTDGDIEGHDAIRRWLAMVRRAFPDIEVDVEILIETDELVAWQRTLQGTHEADFMGFPATGRRLRWRDMITSRFHEGLIAEEWAVSDLAEHMLRAKKG